MKYSISLLFFFTSLFSLYSCVNSNSKNTVKLDNENGLSIVRFDKDLYDLLKNPTAEIQESMKLKYGDFLNAFGSVTINNPDYNSDSYFSALEKYFSNPMLSRIYTDVQIKFADLSAYEKDLAQANNIIKEAFEDKQLPKIYMHVSGFKANTIVLQDIISISADKYLGSDYQPYKQFFEPYQVAQMQPQMIVRDYLKAWLIGEIPTDNKRKDLLSEMLYQGKILYALNQLLPEWNDADLLGYTPEQMKWAEDSQKGIWKVTVQNNYLFSTDYMTIVKYMEDAPYTAAVSTESPGRLGAWVGWQIIKKYVENTDTELFTLLNELDSQKILKASKYNP
ncbi:MAG: hypothetical protein E6772_03630 [Dysgonomonas sp.]|nr:hypothetical protein [Dysgonomonas sp.]